MKTKSKDKDVCTSISECAAIILENFHRGYEHKMKIKKIICLVLFACVLLVTLTSCSETVEERQEKVNEIFEEALNALDVDNTLEIKSNALNDYVTDRGKKTNYTFNVNIAINDESLTGKDIFGIIETIDGVKVSYTTIYRSYSFNDDSYYIEDECILIQGYNHDIAYTPIAEKQGVDLTTAEKDAIL